MRGIHFIIHSYIYYLNRLINFPSDNISEDESRKHKTLHFLIWQNKMKGNISIVQNYSYLLNPYIHL